jgi:type I restriction enzyme M protein
MVGRGRVVDLISGQSVLGTAEEVEATQVFLKRLVEDLGYPPDRIQTRPQFRIRESPSGRERWPVDICIFRDGPSRLYEDAYILVECKRPSRHDGLQQLQLYLQNSFASLGVWFNGQEHLFLRKVILPTGEVRFEEIYSLPKAGQSLADIGHLRRRELTPPSSLKAVFADVRNHLAGMARGTTQDIDFAKQITNILFCKIWDENNKRPDEQVEFFATVGESDDAVAARIGAIFEDRVKGGAFEDVFTDDDRLSLDAASIAYVVGELQNFAITEADREALADAFEIFIGKTLKGPEGQFFTPRNVIRMMVDVLDPKPGETVIDPACGSGGFLVAALEHVWQTVEADGRERGWTEQRIGQEKARIATRYFRGSDKDLFLTKITKAYMAIVGDGRAGIVCENSLSRPQDMSAEAREVLRAGSYDCVLTNPPFGSKIRVTGDATLAQFDLAFRWEQSKTNGAWEKQKTLADARPPQVLFIERCLELLKPGGRLGIVLPESTFGNPSHRYIVEFLRGRAKFLGLVSMPEDLFQPYTHAKACVVFLQKSMPQGADPMFMGVVKWCGHDSRGLPIPHDDVPKVAPRYRALMSGAGAELDGRQRTGFLTSLDEVRDNIFIPKYYDPEISDELERMRATHEIYEMADLIKDRVVSVATGHEIGKLAYGTGPIPFVRTSDLANWEIKIDPKQGVSQEIYDQYAQRQDVRPLDILMVRDGTYLIGTSAMVTRFDTKMLFQSHLYKIRVRRPELLEPHLLLAVLNTAIVKRQIRSKQFTQDIIDTLGSRVAELRLPIPRDEAMRTAIIERTRTLVESRALLREEAHAITELVAGGTSAEEEALADVF